jgi:twitching motility protein PilT
VRNLIRENQVPQIYSMIQTGSRYGMITMEDYVQDLLDAGSISRDTARAAMMQVHEEIDEERDGEYASAALGGGKVKDGSGGASSSGGGQAAGGGDAGGYSF